jgi:charged multivesicular body protein 2A
MNDFERESSTMDMKEEMMSDAVDDAMEGEDEGEGEEMEGDKILQEVLEEIGMGMNDAVSPSVTLAKLRYGMTDKQLASAPTANPVGAEAAPASRVAVAEGLPSMSSEPSRGGGGGGPMSADEMDLQKRLDALRRD